MTACNELSFLTCEGGVVYGECHCDGRLVDLNERESLRCGRVAQCITDTDIRDTCNADDLTDGSLCNFLSAEAGEAQELNDPCVSLTFLLNVYYADILALLNSTSLNSSDGDSADIRIGVDVGNEQLHGSLGITLRAGCILDDGVENGAEISSSAFCVILKIEACYADLTG